MSEWKSKGFPKPTIKEEEISAVLGGNVELLNKLAAELGKYYATGYNDSQKLSSSQIRNILDSIQRMSEYKKNQLQLLRPKLAYIAGKENKKNDRGEKIRHLQKILDKAITKTNENNFEMFVNFFEAIVAYHKFNGGD